MEKTHVPPTAPSSSPAAQLSPPISALLGHTMALWPLEWDAFVRLQSAVGAVKIHLGPYTTWTENTIRKAKGGKKKREGERGSKGGGGGRGKSAIQGLAQPHERPKKQCHIEDAPWNTKRNQGLIVISGQTAKSTVALQQTAYCHRFPFPLPCGSSQEGSSSGMGTGPVLLYPPRSGEAPSSASLWQVNRVSF